MSDPRSTSFATARGLVTIDADPDPSRPAKRREAEHLSFLTDHWPQLKGAAYSGFREHGAGAVVLWREGAPRRWRQRPFEPERLWYTTQAHVLPGATEAHFSGWEARLIETYDPEREALVVFAEGGLICGYRLRGSVAPPDARMEAAARLN